MRRNIPIGREPKSYSCCDFCGELFNNLEPSCGWIPVKNAPGGFLFVCKKCNTPPLSHNLVKLTSEDYGVND